MKILRGQLPDPTPEQRLWLAVIEQAVREGYAGVPGDPDRREEAREWLQSEHFAELAVSLGLHPHWARDTIGKLDRLGMADAVGEFVPPHATMPAAPRNGCVRISATVLR
ncbi:MAG: hypothetical protein AB1578_12110 [Thermodesulfobacteriota bacterium]